MSDYRAKHLPHDLPPFVETPDLPGAGGPAADGAAQRGQAAKPHEQGSPAGREEPAEGGPAGGKAVGDRRQPR
jgi:hypothetical protein